MRLRNNKKYGQKETWKENEASKNRVGYDSGGSCYSNQGQAEEHFEVRDRTGAAVAGDAGENSWSIEKAIRIFFGLAVLFAIIKKMRKNNFLFRSIDNRKDKRSPPATNFHVRKSMQGNKGKNTFPELLLRSFLRRHGITGYRLHWKIPGNPDIVFVGKKICIFIHGCFWHRCPFCKLPIPRKNTIYWANKFEKNLSRDQAHIRILTESGWKTKIVWECELKKSPDSVARRVVNFIRTNSSID